jgi:hypothetical protein
LIRRQAGSRDVESTVVKKIKKKLATWLIEITFTDFVY